MYTFDIEVKKQKTESGTKLGEKRIGCNSKNILVKLVGGSNMFSEFESHIRSGNVAIAKEKLKKEGIKLIGDVVGGTLRKSLTFFTDIFRVKLASFFRR